MARQQAQSYTTTALKRWCCDDVDLPSVSTISELHVYDFDNTLFNSPLPNKDLWESKCIGRLQHPDALVAGGWWHNASILSATGQGIDIEESCAWQGHWNEKVVELVRLSMQQHDALTVLLTGRSEQRFGGLVQKICRSKGLGFDMYCLRPTVGPFNQAFTTMQFKQELLSTLMRTYSAAKQVYLYEDRIKHTMEFRLFFEDFNRRLKDDRDARGSIKTEVIEVNEPPVMLEPIKEVAAIQEAINAHNNAILSGSTPLKAKPLQLRCSMLFSAYQVKSQYDIERLRSLIKVPTGAKMLANTIVISTLPATPEMLERAGGLGTTFRFQVKATGHFDNKVWVAQVESIGSQAWSSVGRLQLVLALAQGAKPFEARNITNWKRVAPGDQVQFDATVGAFCRLSIEEEISAATTAGQAYTVTPSRNTANRKRPAPDSDEHTRFAHTDSNKLQATASNRGYPGQFRGAGRGCARGSGSNQSSPGRGRDRW